MDGWMDGSMAVARKNTKYRINLDLIDRIQLCLKIYDLWRHPHPLVDGWVNGWADVKSLKLNKSWPNQDNSIIDILDIFWTFYLIHLSPLWGYFFFVLINIFSGGNYRQNMFQVNSFAQLFSLEDWSLWDLPCHTQFFFEIKLSILFTIIIDWNNHGVN